MLRSEPRQGASSGGIVQYFINLPANIGRRPTNGRYQAEVDGLRFIAIGIVLIGHLAERIARLGRSDAAVGVIEWIAHPRTGVFLFFAISGYVIGRPYVGRLDRLRDGGMKTFFVRRAVRICPPYMIILLVMFALSALFDVESSHAGSLDSLSSKVTSLVASLFYASGIVFNDFPSLFPPGWSLEVEVQFYLLAPLIIIVLYGVLQNTLYRLALLAGSVALTAIALEHQDLSHAYYDLLGYIPFFLVGLIIAKSEGALCQAAGRLGGAWLGWLGMVALAVLFVVDFTLTNMVMTILLELASVATMLIAVRGPDNGFKSFCANPWVALIGGGCYSLYLTHLQVLQGGVAVFNKLAPGLSSAWLMVLGTACLIPACIVVGMVYYVFVERFFMDKSSAKASRTIPASR